MLKKSAAMLAIASLVLTASCKNESPSLKINEEKAKEAEIAHAEAGKMPVAKFDNKEHDFGNIKADAKVEHVYKVTNAGTADLIISEAKPGCGCTVSDYTKTPIKPGATGEIKATFDSKGKSGNVSKTITVTMNTETPTETLKFTANIEGGKTSGISAKTK